MLRLNQQIEFLFSFVKLDPILSDVLLKKGERIELLSWEDIMIRCLGKLSQVHEMIFPKQPPIIIKGQLEPIDITTASRAGNKKVTLVSGLETYRINLEEFAHRLVIRPSIQSILLPIRPWNVSNLLYDGGTYLSINWFSRFNVHLQLPSGCCRQYDNYYISS